MKALILAAGFGNRMRPLTNDIHKTLLQVGGQAIIDRIVLGLIDNGITHAVIVTGYRADDLIGHLTHTFPQMVFEFVHNARYAETNNIYSMALAFEAIVLDDDILLIESDLICAPDVLGRAIHSKHDNVALVSPYVTGLDGTVVQVSGDRITNIFPPHLQDDQFNLFDKFKTLNIYKFSKEFCATDFKRLLVHYAKVIDDNCYYELILGILIYMQRQDIYCEVIDNDAWAEVDDPNDLAGAEFAFNAESRLAILENSFGGYWNYDVLDFCFIRNMHFPTESVLSEIKNNLPFLLQNYGSKQAVLNRKLSYVLQCAPDRVLALNGASQVYPLLGPLLQGKRILVPEPTFGEYTRVLTVADTYGDRVGINLEEVERKLRGIDVCVIVNPNNPSGSVVPTDWLAGVVDRSPHILFVVDESFIDFSDQASLLDTLEENPRANVLVIKSMSKTHGVPGMRLGFVYSCNRGLLDALSAGVPIWNMNSITEFYLEILLKNKSALARSFVQTIADREAFAEELRTLSCLDCVFPSGADFLLVRAAADRPEMKFLAAHLLAREAIYIKDVTAKIADGRIYYRMAVRLPHEHTRLIEAIRAFERESAR